MSRSDPRPGERMLALDPAICADDARLIFIGRIRSPWRTLDQCPKNPREARERGQPASVVIDEPFRAGLAGLEGYSHALLLYWLDQARRDLIVQAPSHLEGPRGVFAVRSPVRPNPIGLAVVRILSIDAAAGCLGIDAIDAIDGTPLIDLKPYLPSVDAVAGAVVG